MEVLDETPLPLLLGTPILGLIVLLLLWYRGRPRSAPSEPGSPGSRVQSRRFVLPLGLRLADPFLPHLAHDQYMRFRQDYQRFREGDPVGARGEASELPTLAWDEFGTEDFEDVVDQDQLHGAPLRALPALFEVDRHLERGDSKVLENRPDIIEELQARINDFRIKYRQYRKGHSFGAGSEAKLLRLLKAAPVDMLPTTKLMAMIRQSKALREHKRRRPTPSEADLQLLLAKAASSRLHVHFGAGRLGLGLVVPAICRSKCPFAIINPPFEEFDKFVEKHRRRRSQGGNLVVLENNGAVYGEMVMVTDDEDLPILQTFLDDIEDWNTDSPRPGILAVTNSAKLKSLLIEHAKTFSTSVGPGMPATTKELLSHVKRDETSGKKVIPSLAACENDHHAVDIMAEKLDGIVAVVGCLVDRISTSRVLVTSDPEPKKGAADEGPSFMRVTTEPWPGLIMIPPFKPGVFAFMCPFQGEQVLRPKVPAEANYITRRKIVTVNGMHTTLAFLALNEHAETVRKTLLEGENYTVALKDDKLIEPEAKLRLVTVESADEATRKIIWSWVVARQLLLLFEIGTDVMMIAHEIDESAPQQEREQTLCDIMWKYAKECVLRFDTMEDTCGRVLGGGVANRLRTRLRPVHTFLDSNPNLHQVLGGVAAKMLRTAQVDLADMVKSVSQLNSAAERLVGLQD